MNAHKERKYGKRANNTHKAISQKVTGSHGKINLNMQKGETKSTDPEWQREAADLKNIVTAAGRE